MKQTLGILVCLACGAIIINEISRSRNFQLCGTIISRINTTERIVLLTFDDGPFDGPGLDAVLAVLARFRVPATFFVQGACIERNPDAAAKIVAAGHALGNHGYSHTLFMGKSMEFITREIETTDALIRGAGHKGLIFFRPPYARKLIALPLYLAKNDRITLLWDVEPDIGYDPAADAETIARATISAVRPGSIILLHVLAPGREASLQALPIIINRLRDRGFGFVRMDQGGVDYCR